MSSEIKYIEKEYYESVRTYFWGKFYGKYRGNVDEKTIEIPFETHYDIEIYEGVVNTKKAYFQKYNSSKVLSEIIEFKKEPIYKASFPNTVRLNIEDSNNQYDIHINEPRLKNIKLKNHIIENYLVFGEVEADISGFIVHQVKKTKRIEIEEKTKIAKPEITPQITEPPATPQPPQIITPPITEPPATPQPPQIIEEPITPQPPLIKEPKGCWETLKEISLWLIVIILLIPMLIYGWPVLIVVFTVGLILYLLSLIPDKVYGIIGNTIFYTLIVFFLGVLLASIIDTVNKKSKIEYTPKPKNEETEKIDSVKVIEIDSIMIPEDSMIINSLNWVDYNGNFYNGFFLNKFEDYKSSNRFRNNLNLDLVRTNVYNKMIKSLFYEDNIKLSKIYNMFDTIQSKNNLNQFEFAEMVVSCIQHIPYVLLLNNDCNFDYKNDAFIKSYLEEGGECLGNVKFGIYTPIEFTTTLKGDCDTRTLLLFSIFNHFGYDVVILGSELYKHSIIGINLPYRGLSKSINGKKYYVWETTSIDFIPGYLDPSISNIDFWNINLKN